MDLNLDNLFGKVVIFPTVPYHRGKIAHEFFNSIKTNDFENVQYFVEQDRFIVYEYDHLGKSCLHWAAQRNYHFIIKYLIKSGA